MPETSTQDWSEALRKLAEPWAPGDRIKTAINRVSGLTGLGYWRAHDIWYRRARRIEAFEEKAIADALKRRRVEDAENDLVGDLQARIERLEQLLAVGEGQVSGGPIAHRHRRRPLLQGGRRPAGSMA